MTEPFQAGLSVGVVEGVDVDAVHAAVLHTPGVAGLGSNHLGAVATYLPGRRVPGVRVTSDSVEIEVRSTWGTPIDALGRGIRAALARVAPGRRIDINVADIELPGEEPEPPALPAVSGSPPELASESEIR